MAARRDESEPGYSAALASWIASVDRRTLEPIVNDLSGETSALIGGSPFAIRTRFAKSGRPGDMAEQYVYEHLLSYGLTSVGYQSFVRDGVVCRNVVGEIVGTGHPNEIVLVGPHLDSISGAQSATLAPGADDNASGVAAALYMAKVFAYHRFDRTVRFVFFDGEELGKYGSFYYAGKAKTAGENIVAMLAPDMLAYNAGSGVLALHTRSPGAAGEPADRAIAQQSIDVASTYSISGAKPTLFADGKTWSDHQDFWNAGYPAIMMVQDLSQEDPRHHTTEDTVSRFVWSYYVGAAKVLLGAVASEAGLVSASPTPTPTQTPIPTPTPTAKPVLGTPVCPASVRHGTTFKVYGALRPHFAAGAKTVKVKAYRYARGKWTLYKTFAAVNADYGTYTRYRAKPAITRTGKYRFKAFTAATAQWVAATSRSSTTLTVR